MSTGRRLPYPGLRAYSREETDLFFGRDGCVNEMVDRLAATHFLAVLGASGSGKSSLVRTGLLDALELGFMRKAGTNWVIADFSPSSRPFRALAEALLEAKTGSKPSIATADNLEAFLRRGPRSVVEWVEDCKLTDGANLLILTDQFEELFRYGDYTGREIAEAFAALLLDSARAKDRIFVVITMRSEYLGACALIPGLAEQINASLYLTRRMTRAECRLAIEGPPRVLGFDIEPRLVTRLLNDLAGFAPWEADQERSQLQRLSRQADQLPLMQHVLSRLWRHAVERSSGGRVRLTLQDYVDIGHLEGALDRHGTEVMESLSPEAQAIVPALFQALVTGFSLADAIRRPLTFARLIEITGADRAVVAEVVEAFRARGCNFLRPPDDKELADGVTIDIGHESLIRQWGRLAGWFAHEARSTAIWARLVQAEERYRAGEGELISGLDLANALAWWDETNPTRGWADSRSGHYGEVRRFLDESLEDEERYVRAERERQERERESQRELLERRERENAYQRELLETRERENARQRELLETRERENAKQRELLETREREKRGLRKRNAVLVALAIVCLTVTGYALSTNRRLAATNEELGTATAAAHAAAAAAKAQGDIAKQEKARADVAADAAKLRAEEARKAAQDARTQEEIARKQTELARQEKARADEAARLAEERLTQAQTNVSRRLIYTARQIAPIDVDQARGLMSAALPTELGLAGELMSREAMAALHSVTSHDRLQRIFVSTSKFAVFSPDGGRVATAGDDNGAHIWDVMTGREMSRLGHDGTVNAAAFSPNGSQVVTASADKTARVWDNATSKQTARLGHDDTVSAAKFSPDGNRVVTASADKTARIWDVATGKELWRLTHEGTVNSAAFSLDGSRVVTGSADKTARVWDSVTGEQLARLSHDDEVNEASFSPDGSRVVTASSDGTARIWDAATGKEIVRLGHDVVVFAASFSHDGKRVVTSSWDTAVRIWDAVTGKEIARLSHDNAAIAAGFSPDGSRVVTASYDSTARIWDAATGKEIARLGHDEVVLAASFSPDSSRVVTASMDKTVRIWDAAADKEFVRLAHQGYVYAGDFSPNGTRVVTASADKTARIWDVATGGQVARLKHDDAVIRAVFSPDGRHVATASADKTARIWDAATGKEVARLGHDGGVIGVGFSSDGGHVVTGSFDSTARIWDTATGKEVARLKHDDAVIRAVFSPDGRHVATASTDKTARIWDAATGKEVARLKHDDAVFGVGFSSDGGHVVTGSFDSTAHIWDTATGKEIAQLRHNDPIVAAHFSPNGDRVVTASMDSTARIWDTATGKEIARLGHEGPVSSAGFSPNGARVVTASADKTARIWDAATGKEIKRLGHDGGVVMAAFSPDGKHVVTASRDNTARIWKEPLEFSIALPVALASEVRPLTDFERDRHFLGPRNWQIELDKRRRGFSECDRLAAHPYDRRLGPGGVYFEVLEATKAIAACQKAIEEHPGEPRYRYELGRALLKADKKAQALMNYDAAAKMGYPMAYYSLAQAYEAGDGVPKNDNLAAELLAKSFALGETSAGSYLARLYWIGAGVAKDESRAIELWRKTAAAGDPPSHERLAELAMEDRPGQSGDLAIALYHYAIAVRLYEELGETTSAVTARYHRASLAHTLNAEIVAEQWRQSLEFKPAPLSSQAAVP